jgi:hypothetical protein
VTAAPLASPEGWQVSVPCWLVGRGMWMAVEVMAGEVMAVEASEAGAYGGQGDAVGADGGRGSWRLGCWS